MTLMEAPAIESASARRIDSVIAIMSMLHEPADQNSATRRFRGISVLEATIERLGRAARVRSAVVLCWEDQADAVGQTVCSRDRARPVPSPLYSGERVRVRGGVPEEHGAATGTARAKPLTPALSPEYRGEG